MASFVENVLVMVLTVAIVLGGFYLLLLLLDKWLRFKIGSREQNGLTDLLVSTHSNPTADQNPNETPDPDNEIG